MLFRREALAHYQRGQDVEAHVLELEPRWTRYASRVIVGLFAAALLFAALVRVDRYADGVGIAQQGRVVAYVPARYRAQLRPSLPLRFEFAERPLAVASVDPTIVASPRGEPAVRVEAPLQDPRIGDGVTGRVRIRLGRERLLSALLPWSGRG